MLLTLSLHVSYVHDRPKSWTLIWNTDRGQGGNHSVQDVLNLVSVLKKTELGGASRAEEIARYEEELIRRGKEEVQISVQTALTVHNWETLLESPLMRHGMTKMS